VHKKLTITIDEQVYGALHERIGRGNISHFIESLVRPHVIPGKLDEAYQQMAQDEVREQDAEYWSEALIGDISDESW